MKNARGPFFGLGKKMREFSVLLKKMKNDTKATIYGKQFRFYEAMKFQSEIYVWLYFQTTGKRWSFKEQGQYWFLWCQLIWFSSVRGKHLRINARKVSLASNIIMNFERQWNNALSSICISFLNIFNMCKHRAPERSSSYEVPFYKYVYSRKQHQQTVKYQMLQVMENRV